MAAADHCDSNRKYRILHQLIDKILVSKAEKVDGEYVQKIQIFYRFIGPLDAIE